MRIKIFENDIECFKAHFLQFYMIRYRKFLSCITKSHYLRQERHKETLRDREKERKCWASVLPPAHQCTTASFTDA